MSSCKNGHPICVNNVLYIENQLLVMKKRNLRISFALIPADSSLATIIPLKIPSVPCTCMKKTHLSDISNAE